MTISVRIDQLCAAGVSRKALAALAALIPIAGIGGAASAQMIIPASAATEIVHGAAYRQTFGGDSRSRSMGRIRGDNREWMATVMPAGSHGSTLATGMVLLYVTDRQDGDIALGADRIVGEGATFGAAVAICADVNGDGAADIIVGAPGDSVNDGRVYVYSGVNTSLLRTLQGQVLGERFGTSVSAAADWNGDGVPDIAVGAPGVAPGRVYVFSGADGSLLRMYHGPSGGSGFGEFIITYMSEVTNTPGMTIGGMAPDATGALTIKGFEFYTQDPPLNPDLERLGGKRGQLLDCESLPPSCERDYCIDIRSADNAYDLIMHGGPNAPYGATGVNGRIKSWSKR